METDDWQPLRRVLALVVLASLLNAGVVVATDAAGPSSPQTAPSGADVAAAVTTTPQAAVQSGGDADNVLLSVNITADGTGQWAIEYRYRLETENDTAAFESLRRDIEQNRSAYLDRFSRRINTTVANAANATGREMAASNFSVEAHRTTFGREYGVVTYRFSWSNFGVVDGKTIRAGDALSGLFLDSGTTLLFSWPAGYEVASVSPPASERRERALVWEGQLNFAPGEPSVSLQPTAGATGTTGQATTTPAGQTGSLPLGGLVAGLLVLVVLAGGVWFARDRGMGPWAATDAPPADAGATGAVGAAAASDDATDGTAERPPPELLSNEERVLHLLEERGGRIKQQEVVEGLDWTAAKTSQVVTKMRDEGTVEVFRIGRENVIRLPEEEEEDGDE